MCIIWATCNSSNTRLNGSDLVGLLSLYCQPQRHISSTLVSCCCSYFESRIHYDCVLISLSRGVYVSLSLYHLIIFYPLYSISISHFIRVTSDTALSWNNLKLRTHYRCKHSRCVILQRSVCRIEPTPRECSLFSSA